MPDGLDGIVALKNSVLFLILSKLLQIMYVFLVSSNYMNTGVTFNLLSEANAWRSSYVGWTNVFIFAIFFNTEKID